MKKIKFENQEKPTVNFEELNDDSIVGSKNIYGKKLIVRTSDGFCSISNKSVDFRNLWKEPTLKEYVEKFNKQLKSKFYQFDTVKDALKWMSK